MAASLVDSMATDFEPDSFEDDYQKALFDMVEAKLEGAEPAPVQTTEAAQERWVIPDDELFLMGDHRQDSADSRAFGPVPKEHVIGRAWLRYWPFDHFGVLNTPTYAAPSESQAAP